jgi:hypothetical protein
MLSAGTASAGSCGSGSASAAVYLKLIRRRFGAKPKVARPSDIKNADAAAAFLATVEEQLLAAIPVSNRLPIHSR